MPDPDPAALKAAQAAAARSRKALADTDTALAAARLAAEGARAALAAARRSGATAAAVQRAEAALRRADSQREALNAERGRLRLDRDGLLRDHLRRLQLEAPGDLPLLLLPLRLETRFGEDSAGKPLLRIRIFPDDIHIDRSGGGVSPEEAEAGRLYWLSLFPQPAGADPGPAWNQLRKKVGDLRARAVALATRPLNPADRGGAAAPQFPTPPARDGLGAQARLLPERFRVSAWQNGTLLRATGAPVAPDLVIGPLVGEEIELTRQGELAVFEGAEWLTDYDRALSAGMAIELPLPARAPISQLYVYGLRQLPSAAQAAEELAGLLRAHDGAGLLHLVPQGTPTNNTEAEASGWRRWRESTPVPLTPEPFAPQSNAGLLGRALGLAPEVWEGAAGAARRDQPAQAAMQATLWPATWGYFLETVDARQETVTPPRIEEARVFHVDHIRPAGPLPSFAVGSQPYAVLPVMPPAPPKRGASSDPIAKLLADLLPNWREAVATLPRIRDAADTDRLMEIYGTAPHSWGVKARKVLSHDFLQAAGQITSDADEARELEMLLTNLINLKIGFMSETFPFTSLDAEARPVLLPLADPARDADWLRALIEGRSPGAVSSVLQALTSLGWNKLRAKASPKGDLPGSIRQATAVSATLRERALTLVADALAPVVSATRTPVTTYDSLIAALPSEVSGLIPLQAALPLGMAALTPERALAATSIEEREALSLGVLLSTLRAARELAAMRAGIEGLIAEAASGAPDFSALVAGGLDVASHRIDAWITGLASRRLAAMRAAKPEGISLGAWGWLFDLAPEPRRGARPGGFVAAPTLEQATTAGLLRAAWLAHDTGDATAGAFATDLSSGRVRRALGLAEGVANGQPLGAVLGYDFERRLAEADLQRFVLSFRQLAPLRAGQLTDSGDGAETRSAAEVNVTDMLRLLDRRKAEGEAVLLQKLEAAPQNSYLSIGEWRPPTTAEKTKISSAFAAAEADCDALADLMTAEAVHQLAQGNVARAAAVMDAAGKGEAPPPTQPDVVVTHGPGVIVTHRLCALAGPGGAAAPLWADSCPRSATAPELELWAASRLPDPRKVPLGPRAGGGAASLADCGLAALDFAALSDEPGFLQRLIRLRAPLANPDADFPDAAGPGAVPLEEAMLVAAALQAVIRRAVPLGAVHLGTRTEGWAAAPGAPDAALARLAAAQAVLGQRAAVLRGVLSAPGVARPALMAALLDLSDFGITFPEGRSAQTAEFAGLALAEAEARGLRAAEALSAAPQSRNPSAIAEILFGPDFRLPLPIRFTPTASQPESGAQALPDPPPGALQRYLADFGAVRPAVADFQRLSLLAQGSDHGPRWLLKQFCGQGERLPTGWIGASLPADQPSPNCPIASMLIDAPLGLDPAADFCGLLIDEWTEVLPERRAIGEGAAVESRITAGVALHADAPGAEPPQSLLLALSPDGARWTEDGLCALLSECLALAQTRLVTLETLPLLGRVLPAIYTQSWSLQGEPVIDWRQIALEGVTLPAHVDIGNFIRQREG